MEVEKKRKSSSPPEDDEERKRRRTEAETEAKDVLQEMAEMVEKESNVPRAIEMQKRARELSEEIRGFVESEEDHSPPPSPPPTRKLTAREKKRKEKKDADRFMKKHRALAAKLEREKDKKKLASDLVSGAEVRLLTELEKESKESASFLKANSGQILKAPKSIDEFKSRIVKRAVEIWKTNTSDWNPMEHHNCFTGGFVGVSEPPEEGEWKCAGCERNVSVKRDKCPTCGGVVRSEGAKMESCPMAEIRVRIFSLPSHDWKFHVCVENMCATDGVMSMREDSHSHEVKNDLTLFACELSGTPHLCGEDCDTDFLNSDHEYSCLLTGRGTYRAERRGDRWQPSGNRSTCDAWKYNPLDRSARARFYARYDSLKELLDNEVLFNNARYLQSRVVPTVKEMVKEMPPKNNLDARKMAFSAVYLKILCVFSDDRFDNDASQNAKKKKETSILLDKYLGRCEQESRLGNAADMFSIVTTRRLRTCYNPQVNLGAEEKSALAAYYAKKVILLWCTVLTKTHEGRVNPGRFQLDDFVTTALHLFHNGFEIPASSSGSRVQLIVQDPLFAAFPITSWIEAKLHPRLKEPKKRNKSISRTKKAVLKALKGALDGGMSPEELKTERMDYMAMDQTVFARLRKS